MSKRDWHFVVLDDRFEDRFFLSRTIRRYFPEAQTNEFIFAEEAFAHLKSRPRDEAPIVFVHINPPQISGFDFIDLCSEQIYADEDEKTPYFVITSTAISKANQERAFEDDRIWAALAKPITNDMLTSILDGIETAQADEASGSAPA